MTRLHSFSVPRSSFFVPHSSLLFIDARRGDVKVARYYYASRRLFSGFDWLATLMVREIAGTAGQEHVGG